MPKILISDAMDNIASEILLKNNLDVETKTDLSSEMNDVVREPSLDSHFTDSTKPARLYFDTKRFNDCFSIV